MSQHEELHHDMIKYCYDIVAQVFEKAQNDATLREECIRNGTLQKFIERIGALTGEKARSRKSEAPKEPRLSSNALPVVQAISKPNKSKPKAGIGYAPNSSNTNEVWNVSEYIKSKEARNAQVGNLLHIVREVMKCEGWSMPGTVKTLMLESALLPAIEAALRSGSLLEMAKDFEMNKNYLLLVQELAAHEDLMSLLVDIGDQFQPRQKSSISDLLSSLAEQNEMFLQCLDKTDEADEKNE